MRDRHYYTYIMASRSRVLYIGVTNNIVRRTAEHKAHTSDGFTARHRCARLVWCETYHSPTAAIAREKELKGWSRTRKIALIEETNPGWLDLGESWDRVPQYGEDTNLSPGRTTIFHTQRPKKQMSC